MSPQCYMDVTVCVSVCGGSRAAGNMDLPEGSKGKRRACLSYLFLSSCLIGWFGVSAMSRRN